MWDLLGLSYLGSCGLFCQVLPFICSAKRHLWICGCYYIAFTSQRLEEMQIIRIKLRNCGLLPRFRRACGICVPALCFQFFELALLV